MEDLDAASLDDVGDFFRKYYAPSNASLAIAGDFDPDDARRLVERYFGDIPPGSPISRVGRMESDLRGQVSLSMRDRVQLARLYLVWPTGPIFGPDEAAVTMLSGVLGDGRSSRLYDSLVYKQADRAGCRRIQSRPGDSRRVPPPGDTQRRSLPRAGRGGAARPYRAHHPGAAHRRGAPARQEPHPQRACAPARAPGWIRRPSRPAQLLQHPRRRPRRDQHRPRQVRRRHPPSRCAAPPKPR